MTIVSEHDIEELRFSLKNRLGEALLLTSQEDMLRYCRDWHGDVTSSAVAVIRPRSTEEVSDTVRACAELGLAIIPQGGNTGLVLGGIPDAPGHQIVLSLERMNAIRTIDGDDFSAVVEAGCILSEFKDAVQDKGMFFPLSLGAQGSCRIGGNVSTNAGGINVLRYGMTRELVLGLEVVLPDGTVWNGLSTLRKDNRGIDLKQLFIGAEGTLGIITAVAVKLYPNPEHVETALLGLNSLDDAIKLYRRARRECCDLMSAFEFMPPVAFTLAIEAIPDLRMPIAGDYPAYVLMEISGSGLVDTADLMGRFLEGVMEDGLVLDGVIASSRAQAQSLWLFREGMNEVRRCAAAICVPTFRCRFRNFRLSWPRRKPNLRKNCRNALRFPMAMSVTATSISTSCHPMVRHRRSVRRSSTSPRHSSTRSSTVTSAVSAPNTASAVSSAPISKAGYRMCSAG